MKRLHVHVSVEDLQHSIGFYSALFAVVGLGRPNSAALQRHDPGLIPSLFMSDSRISFVIGKKPLRSVCS